MNRTEAGAVAVLTSEASRTGAPVDTSPSRHLVGVVGLVAVAPLGWSWLGRVWATPGVPGLLVGFTLAGWLVSRADREVPARVAGITGAALFVVAGFVLFAGFEGAAFAVAAGAVAVAGPLGLAARVWSWGPGGGVRAAAMVLGASLALVSWWAVLITALVALVLPLLERALRCRAWMRVGWATWLLLAALVAVAATIPAGLGTTDADDTASARVVVGRPPAP